MRIARQLPWLLSSVVCAVAIAACGSSSKPSGGSASAAATQGIKFADCMRSHGVPNFPDPSGGGGIKIPVNSGINPFSPAFKQAQSACRKLLPGGGPGQGPPSAQAKARMLQTSECMRAHGVSGFPDPTTTPPSNPQDFSLAMGRGGVFLAVPKTINPSSPGFQQAAKVCGFG